MSGFNAETGEYVCEGCGGSFPFLPAKSAQSAPYEFIHAACSLPDPSKATELEAVAVRDDDAHKAAAATGTQAPNRHHIIDPQAVADFYEAHGDTFTAAGSKDDYIAASKAHADRVAAVQAGGKIDPKTGEVIAAAGESSTPAS